MSLFLNGTEFNDIIFNSVNTTGMFNGTTVWGSSPVYTLTLQNDGHGTLTADKITGKAGDTVILSPTYNTYYRFSGYNITGGSVVGNTFTFGNEDATAKATFKVNAFTASGQWQQLNRKGGQNVSTANYSSYPKITYRTSNVPTGWSASRNGVAAWNPGSNLSAYNMYNKMHIYITRGYSTYNKATAYYYIGSTNLYSINLQTNGTKSITYNRADSNIGIPCNYVHMGGYGNLSSDELNWTATGIAP